MIQPALRRETVADCQSAIRPKGSQAKGLPHETRSIDNSRFYDSGRWPEMRILCLVPGATLGSAPGYYGYCQAVRDYFIFFPNFFFLFFFFWWRFLFIVSAGFLALLSLLSARDRPRCQMTIQGQRRGTRRTQSDMKVQQADQARGRARAAPKSIHCFNS